MDGAWINLTNSGMRRVRGERDSNLQEASYPDGVVILSVTLCGGGGRGGNLH